MLELMNQLIIKKITNLILIIIRLSTLLYFFIYLLNNKNFNLTYT